MWLYQHLSRVVSRKLAGVLTAFWLGILIFAVLFGAFEPQASFIYGNI